MDIVRNSPEYLDENPGEAASFEAQVAGIYRSPIVMCHMYVALTSPVPT